MWLLFMVVASRGHWWQHQWLTSTNGMIVGAGDFSGTSSLALLIFVRPTAKNSEGANGRVVLIGSMMVG